MNKIMIFFFAALSLTMLSGCQTTTTPITPTVLLNEHSLTLNIGEIFTLAATVSNSEGQYVVYTSDNAEIANVSDNGTITGVGAGSCKVIAALGTASDTCNVTVLEYEAPDIPQNIDGYAFVWSDEFNGGVLNAEVWNIEVSGSGGGNNELQYYTARQENVSLGTDPESGEKCLILTAIKENYSGKTCTSGRVNSKKKFAFEHGLIEARVKIPQTANGLWPAFWLMGDDYDEVGWPQCGEIDIMEMGNANGIGAGTQDRYFNGATHWGQSWENHPNYAHAVTNSYSVQETYHTFRLYWDNEKLSMYLDKEIYPAAPPYYEMAIAASDNQNSPGYYFHKPVFILFNLAVGGDFTGIHNINNITALGNTPVNFYIDYVRLYQKNP
jgi:beta-glucanase (GH16 family)